MSRIEPKVTSVYPPPERDTLSHEQIALRAYSKWLERGCPEGDGESDWHAALAELQQEQRGKSAPPAAKPQQDGKADRSRAA